MSPACRVVCLPGGDRAAAGALAARLGTSLSDVPKTEPAVVFDETGVSLTGSGMRFQGDFTAMLRRVTGGHLPHEMLAHIARTKKEAPTAVDATAGMGEDSLILAACGYRVVLFEQNPVVAALLRDALRRAQDHPELGPIVARMTLREEDSVAGMGKLDFTPDLIYLDPMFPARQKSGLVGKKLQLIQKLEQPCAEESDLLTAALNAHPGKLVIKRPLKGACLGGMTPQYSIKGKAIRYDCFTFTVQ